MSYLACICTLCICLTHDTFKWTQGTGNIYTFTVHWQKWACAFKTLLVLERAVWVKTSQVALSDHRSHTVIWPTSFSLSLNQPKTVEREGEHERKVGLWYYSLCCLFLLLTVYSFWFISPPPRSLSRTLTLSFPVSRVCVVSRCLVKSFPPQRPPTFRSHHLPTERTHSPHSCQRQDWALEYGAIYSAWGEKLHLSFLSKCSSACQNAW